LKDVELRVIRELIRDCRRSDRELAKPAGVSQPTVSRIRPRLEKEGVLDYTAVPNLAKLGFEILAFTFAKLKHPLTPEDLEKARKDVHGVLNKENASVILGMSGMGCDADRVLVSFHEHYSAYLSFIRFIKSQSLVEIDGAKNFIVNLLGEKHFLPLNFTGIAGYILKSKELSKSKQTA
jgi:DNA-binding Lrp family transcriptional regulator